MAMIKKSSENEIPKKSPKKNNIAVDISNIFFWKNPYKKLITKAITEKFSKLKKLK